MDDPRRADPDKEVSETGSPTDESRRPTWLEDVEEPPRRRPAEADVPEPSEQVVEPDSEPIDP